MFFSPISLHRRAEFTPKNVLVSLVHFLVSIERNQDILMGHGWGRGCDGGGNV